MRILLLLFFALLLAACSSGGNGSNQAAIDPGSNGGSDHQEESDSDEGNGEPEPVGTVHIACADVHNGTASDCIGGFSGDMHALATTSVVDFGTVNRNKRITATAVIRNDSESQYVGYLSVVLDVHCKKGEGAPWDIVTLHPIIVDSMTEETVSFDGFCTRADGGQATVTYSLYDQQAADDEFLRDRVVGTVEIVDRSRECKHSPWKGGHDGGCDDGHHGGWKKGHRDHDGWKDHHRGGWGHHSGSRHHVHWDKDHHYGGWGKKRH
ncbi:MAG TPA: hypothetical protein VIL43_12960 [Burkholderiales bacterium]